MIEVIVIFVLVKFDVITIDIIIRKWFVYSFRVILLFYLVIEIVYFFSFMIFIIFISGLYSTFLSYHNHSVFIFHLHYHSDQIIYIYSFYY